MLHKCLIILLLTTIFSCRNEDIARFHITTDSDLKKKLYLFKEQPNFSEPIDSIYPSTDALQKDTYPWKQYNYDEILNKVPYFHKLGIKGPSGILIEKSGKILAKNIKTSKELVKHLEQYWGN
jgi:hypothetical protein